MTLIETCSIYLCIIFFNVLLSLINVGNLTLNLISFRLKVLLLVLCEFVIVKTLTQLVQCINKNIELNIKSHEAYVLFLYLVIFICKE